MQACTPVASAFPDLTLMDASGSYLSSPGIPNHTKCNNNNFFPLHTYCNKCLDWAKTKWKLVWVCVLTSLDRSVGLCNRPLWKSLLLSPPVWTFSPEATFPFIIFQQQVRAFLFCGFWFPCQNSLLVSSSWCSGFLVNSSFLGISSLERHFTLTHILRDFSLIRR